MVGGSNPSTQAKQGTNMPKKGKKDRQTPYVLHWWMVPKKDDNHQWWWGYQKVRLVVLPEEEKLTWLRSMGYGNNEDRL